MNSRVVAVRSIAVLVALCGLASFRASAIVDARSFANTNAPGDGSAWANVGNIAGASGIYIGGGWVLTAAHIGIASIDLGGTIYAPDGIGGRLTNSAGTETDMVVFHLASIPNLPRLDLTSTTPTASYFIDLVGNGHIAGGPQTNFGTLTGFPWSAGAYKSWGNNKVGPGGVTTINAGFGDLRVFSCDFTSSTGAQTSHEAQATAGDSGGAVFFHDPSGWELAGMIDTIDVLTGQPDNTSVYGQVTYMADIASYRNQIIAWQTSVMPSLSISSVSTNVQVCWLDTGAKYKLQVSDVLPATNWTVLTPPLLYANGQVCAVLGATNSARFFRLQK